MTDKENEKALIKAVAKARMNLVNYRYIMLVCGKGEVKSPPYHYRWSDLLLTGTENTVIEGYRESAKSQYVLRSFPLYALTFPSDDRDYIILIKKNTTQAEKKLKEIEQEYNSNPAISANCKEIKEQSGQVFSVDVKNDAGEIVNVRIEAYGKGASVRGLSYLDKRPKICIVDDPQDVEDAKSETVQENDWNWFMSDVMFLGQHTRIFLIGNNLGERCIVERVFENAKQLNFVPHKIPQIINEKSAWPEKFSLEKIKAEKEAYRQAGKLDIWLRERMCEATSEETRIFNKNDYRYYSANTVQKVIQGCNLWATLDPASSPNIESCYRALVINAVDEDNKWFIVDVPFGRWNSAELMDILFEKVVEWELQIVGIEKGEFKDVIEPFIYKEMSRKNIFFDIAPLEHAKIGPKLQRIKMLQPRFKAHQIWFPNEADWLAEMESELHGVTKNAIKSLYIDLVDALAMQEQIAQAPYKQPRNQDLPREAVMT